MPGADGSGSASSTEPSTASASTAGCAVLLGGPLAWTGPLAYLFAGVYALYTDWHPPVLSTPWLWPARPPHDVGGALCAAAVFAAGLIAFTVRGGRAAADG